ncbi:MAG: ATP/GTP-binding protein [Promethearchaeota archaeon]
MTINTSKRKNNNIAREDSKGSTKLKDGLIQFKIVYWGPGESGKTTNFFRLREKFNLTEISQGYSIETTDGRTLWQDALFFSFDFEIDGKIYEIIVQVVTCTGQERFLSTREYVLDGADGIVFVADSNLEKMDENKRSFRELKGFTGKKQVPYVIQLNKRDLENAVPIRVFKKQLGLPLSETHPDDTKVLYPTKALSGDNVVPCFEDLMVQVIFNYFKYQLS